MAALKSIDGSNSNISNSSKNNNNNNSTTTTTTTTTASTTTTATPSKSKTTRVVTMAACRPSHDNNDNNEDDPIWNQCYGCDRTGYNMPQCAGCLAACYCSKPCQMRHWPLHKKYCRLVACGRGDDKEVDRDFRLFRDWTYRMAHLVTLYCCHGVSAAQLAEMQKTPRNDQVFAIDVELDYNTQSFHPTWPVQVVDANNRPGVQLGHQPSWWSSSWWFTSMPTSIGPVAALVRWRSYELVVPVNLQLSLHRQMEISEILQHCDRLSRQSPAESSLFHQATWVKAKVANLQECISYWTQTTAFQNFAMCALRLNCCQLYQYGCSKNTTLVVECNLGMGLGQIVGFDDFHIDTSTASHPPTAQQVAKAYAKGRRGKKCFNVLGARRKQNEAMSRGKAILVQVSVRFQIPGDSYTHQQTTTICRKVSIPFHSFPTKLFRHEDSDDMAESYFEELVNIPAPAVHNPDLNQARKKKKQNYCRHVIP